MQPIPTSGPVVNWLRDEASQPFVQGREGADDDIIALINKHFDLRPAGIIRSLDLLRPLYKQTAAYGHFGRLDVALPWEDLDKVDALRTDAGIVEAAR